MLQETSNALKAPSQGPDPQSRVRAPNSTKLNPTNATVTGAFPIAAAAPLAAVVTDVEVPCATPFVVVGVVFGLKVDVELDPVPVEVIDVMVEFEKPLAVVDTDEEFEVEEAVAVPEESDPDPEAPVMLKLGEKLYWSALLSLMISNVYWPAGSEEPDGMVTVVEPVFWIEEARTRPEVGVIEEPDCWSLIVTVLIAISVRAGRSVIKVEVVLTFLQDCPM